MKQNISSFLESFARGRYKSAVIRNTPDGSLLIVDKEVIATNRQLSVLKGKLHGMFDLDVTVIRHENHLINNYVEALRLLLAEKIGEPIETVQLDRPTKGKASLFVSLEIDESEITPSIRKKILSVSTSLAKPIGINSIKLNVVGKFGAKISDSRIIQDLVKTAPITAERLAQQLNESGEFDDRVTTKQVAVVLDRLRRNGIAVWQETIGYVPTREALSIFSSFKSRRSSDVLRALDLGRRKW